MKTIQTEISMYSKQDLLDAGVSKNYVRIISCRFRQAGGLDVGDCFCGHQLPKNVQRQLSLKPKPTSDIAANEKEWKMLADAVSAELSIYADLIHENPTLDPDRILDILRAAGWMRLLVEGKPVKLGFNRKPELLRVATMALQAENLSCLRISSPEWLRKRITAWKKLGWRSLVSGKIGLVNAQKRTPEAEQVLKALFADPRRFSAYRVTRIYKEMCASTHPSLPGLSEATIRKIQLSQGDVTTSTIITTSEK